MHKRKSVRSFPVLALLVGLAACSSGIQTSPGIQESEVTPQADSTAWQRIAVATDDAEETLSTGAMVLDSIDLDLGSNASGSTAVGVRFTGLGIPKGAVVKSANLYFLPGADSVGSATMSIQMHSSYTSNTFKTTSKNITSRSLTGTSVSWTVPTWKTTMTLQSAEVKSPNLSSLVQPLINNGAVDSLTFAIKGTGNRITESFEGAAGSKPALEITYTNSVPSTPSCLDTLAGQGELITANKTYPNGLNTVKGKMQGVRVDARGGIFEGGSNAADPKIPFITGSNQRAAFLCLSGGVYNTKAPDNAPWDAHKIGMDGVRDFHNGHGIYIVQTPNTTVERITMPVTGDGVAFKWGSSNWKLRDSYIRHAGDDGVENDWKNNGVIDDVLIDWAYMGISCRKGNVTPEKGEPLSPPGTITIQDSLIALKKQVGTSGGLKPNDPNHLFMFKFEKDDLPNCKLRLKNTVFYMQQNQKIFDSKNSPTSYVEECQDVTLVYTGGTYSKDLAAINALRSSSKFAGKHCFDIVQGSTAISFWQQKRFAWFDRHSDNAQISYYKTREPQGAK